MKLEDQVCSLQSAQKLKALGVKQESLFWWWESTFEMNKGHAVLENHEPNNPKDGWTVFSAFTVAELLIMLDEPVIVPIDGTAAEYLARIVINKYAQES